MAERDDEDRKKLYDPQYSAFKDWFDDFQTKDLLLSGVMEPTLSGILNTIENVYSEVGGDPGLGSNLAKYASEYTGDEFSPEEVALAAIEGPTGLGRVSRGALKAYSAYKGYPVFPGFKPIIQGGTPQTDWKGSLTGGTVPLSRPPDVPTGTGQTITPSWVGLLNMQPSSGMVSIFGGQPRHHTKGLSDIVKNLSGVATKDLGTILSRLVERRSGVDDEDKLAQVWT